jgi:hypothetical protein
MKSVQVDRGLCKPHWQSMMEAGFVPWRATGFRWGEQSVAAFALAALEAVEGVEAVVVEPDQFKKCCVPVFGLQHLAGEEYGMEVWVKGAVERRQEVRVEMVVPVAGLWDSNPDAALECEKKMEVGESLMGMADSVVETVTRTLTLRPLKFAIAGVRVAAFRGFAMELQLRRDNEKDELEAMVLSAVEKVVEESTACVGKQLLSVVLPRGSLAVTHEHVREDGVSVLELHAQPGMGAAAHQLGCVLGKVGVKVNDMRLTSDMRGGRVGAIKEQVEERKQRREAEVRRDEQVQGRRLFVGGIPREGYSTEALLSAMGLEAGDVRFDRVDGDVMLRGSGTVCYAFVEVLEEGMAGRMVSKSAQGGMMMRDRTLKVSIAEGRSVEDGGRQQQVRRQGGGRAVQGVRAFVPAPPPSGFAWSSQGGSSQAVRGSGRQQPARGGDAVQGMGGQGEVGQRQMQLMMQGAVRAVMREAGAQMVSELAGKVVEAVKGAMVVEVGKVVAASMGEIVQQGVRDAVVGQVNASMGAMVTEQHAMVLEVREAVGAVGRVQQQVEETGVRMRGMQEVLQQQAHDLTGFAKETLKRLGTVGDGVEEVRQEGRVTSGGVGTVLASAASIMEGQRAAMAQLHALERQCEEMRVVLGVRRASGDDESVMSSGSASSVVVVEEVGQGQPAKQGRDERSGDGVNQVMSEGPGVSHVPGAVSGTGEERDEAGTAKKQKGVGDPAPSPPS